jgi:phosphoglycerol transferase MdoB-like AlkP superfamily enzyme
MSESRRQLLTIGVFFIIVVVAILLYPAKVITNGWNILQLIIILFGAWMLVLAGIRAMGPQKYERSPYSTVQMGVLLMAFGFAWFLLSVNWIYSLALILLALGVIAIVSAFRRNPPPKPAAKQP